MSGCLYVVATPIGHLDDITIRALNTLKAVALVCAEDTRRTGNLLRHFGIATPATSLHEHNEAAKIDHVLARLEAGEDVALVSDAGTPLLSDPGQQLVQAAATAGFRVSPIPGPSALTAALSVAGHVGTRVTFAGFAPSKSSDRKAWLAEVDSNPHTVVCFEAPHRVHKLLDEIADFSVDRPIIFCRELTKIHEEILRTTVTSIRQLTIEPRGEITLVFGPQFHHNEQPSVAITDEQLAYEYGRMTESGTPRAKMAALATKLGLTTNEVYSRLAAIGKLPPS